MSSAVRARPDKTESPSMAQSSRSSRKFAACVLILCCLGGGAWYFLHEEGKSPVETARNLMQNLTGEKAEQNDSSAASSETAKSEAASAEAGKDNTPQQVGAPLNSGGRPVPLDPQAELLARVDRAMDKKGSAAPDGDIASGKVTDQPPQADAARRDSVVTPRFVNDMAGWLAANYIPSHHEGRGGRSAVTLVQVNARYSNSGTLRSVERDPLKSRSSILNYVFTPGMLEALYRMYAPSFMDEMERSARESRRGRTLSEAQVADMFSVYAEKFQRLAVSLDAAAKADLPALAAAIRREAGNEAEANDSFARAYMALSAARESGNRDEVAIQSRRMAESTRVAGMYASRQERARNDMAYAIRRNAEGRTLSSQELLFLGEWLSRRGSTPEAARAAADVCRRMAEQMKQRADDILNKREAAAPAAQAPAGEKDMSAASPASAAPSAEKTAVSAAPAASAAQNVKPQAEAQTAPAEEKPGTSEKAAAPAESAASEGTTAAPAASGSMAVPAEQSGEHSASAPKDAASGSRTSAAKTAYPEVSGSLTREAPTAAPDTPKTASSGEAGSEAPARSAETPAPMQPESAPSAESGAAASASASPAPQQASPAGEKSAAPASAPAPSSAPAGKAQPSADGVAPSASEAGTPAQQVSAAEKAL